MPLPAPDHSDVSPPVPGPAEAARLWARIGCLSFGGPAAQIALMHREVVERRRWVGDARFLHALNFCTLLPGPEATQLATYLGWLLHGVRGGLLAGLLFILPGAVVLLALTLLYVGWGTVPLVAALFFGLRCAVLALVVEAVFRLARRVLHGPAPRLLALSAFLALAAFGLPFPAVVLAAALLGAAAPHRLSPPGGGETAGTAPPTAVDALLAADPGRMARLAGSARRAGLGMLALWLLPLLLLQGTSPWGAMAGFFSRLAVVTFGGAYAVLAYAAQEAVERQAWLSAADMLAGLGLAETTPGPLILVLQFIGFLGGHAAHGLAGGLAGTALALWMTFVPCFAWVFLGAPHVERLQNWRRLRGALAGITAAVVGVIANLALWFGLRVLFTRLEPVERGWLRLDLPVPSSLDPLALGLALLAGGLLGPAKLGVATTLGLVSLAGLAGRWAGL